MAETPFVSVIVPCRNEAAHLGPLLGSILALAHPRERLEVLFIDGMSTDGSREILEAAARRHRFIRVLDNPRLIAPVAMNLGIRESRGEVIVRLDAHSEYGPDYIARCVRLLMATRAGCAGGRAVVVPGGGSPWAKAVAYVASQVFGIGNGAYRISERPGFVDTVPLGTFRRKVLEEVGLYDERLTRNQDNELNDRLRRHGYKIAFDPAIRVRYRTRGTLRGLLEQGFYNGMWNVYTLLLHPYTWKVRRFVPAAFVGYLFAAAAAAAWAPSRPAAAAALPLALYGVLVAVFSAAGGGAGAGRLRIAATFAAFHVCYGVGTYFGVCNLLTGRWRGHLGRPLRP